MALLADAIAQGLTARAACAVLGVSERRWRDWQARARVGDCERHALPAHGHPSNALTPQERERIRSAVGCAEWADASCRELSVKILERVSRVTQNSPPVVIENSPPPLVLTSGPRSA